MPNYTFRKPDGTEFSEYMKISELDQYLVDNPKLTVVPSAPSISYNDMKKPDDGFRDRLREIKKHHRGNTINTF